MITKRSSFWKFDRENETKGTIALEGVAAGVTHGRRLPEITSSLSSEYLLGGSRDMLNSHRRRKSGSASSLLF